MITTGEEVKTLEPSHTVGRNGEQSSCFGKQPGNSSKRQTQKATI